MVTWWQLRSSTQTVVGTAFVRLPLLASLYSRAYPVTTVFYMYTCTYTRSFRTHGKDWGKSQPIEVLHVLYLILPRVRLYDRKPNLRLRTRSTTKTRVTRTAYLGYCATILQTRQ